MTKRPSEIPRPKGVRRHWKAEAHDPADIPQEVFDLLKDWWFPQDQNCRFFHVFSYRGYIRRIEAGLSDDRVYSLRIDKRGNMVVHLQLLNIHLSEAVTDD